MNPESVHEENIKFVFARLKLAQSLLEESDALPGWSGYDFNSEHEWWRHPRHEREALVNYLLLTCFDRLGQKRGFTTFRDWLKSTRTEHVDERQQVLQTVEISMPALELASALAENYQTLYGVRNSFYRGVESLPDELQKKLLESITITFDPIYGTLSPNTSTPGYPLNDQALERKLRLKYLYDKRNSFTHRLEQYFAASNSFGLSEKDEPSWKVMIEDSRLFYLSGHQEIERLKTGGARAYSVAAWPFVLFETLHAALGSNFHRTDINLKFSVMLRRSSVPAAVITAEVSHDQLKDFLNLEALLWELHAQGLVPLRVKTHQ
mgnify:CR=1 FL=1